MMFRLLILSIVLSCFTFISAYSQVVTYGSHTKDSTFEKQIVDSLSMSTEFYLLLTPKEPVYKYNFKYSMGGRKNQEVGINDKPHFMATTYGQHSVEFKPNSKTNYDCLLTCSPVTLSGSQITNVGIMKDSGFTVPGYVKKNAQFGVNHQGHISNFVDNFETVLSDPAIGRIRALFSEDLDRKFIRYLIPKYTTDLLEVGDEWSVEYTDSMKTQIGTTLFILSPRYKVLSCKTINGKKIVKLEFRSNSNKIHQKLLPGTDFESTMDVDEMISGVYDIDQSTGLPIKLTVNSRIEIIQKNAQQKVVDATRIEQTFDYTLLYN